MSSSWAWAKLSIPTNLSDEDRRALVETLGYGIGAKVLGDPFPLGGYSGVELGITNQFISTEDVSKLGDHASTQARTPYLGLSFAKGLYYNFDVFINFVPVGQDEQVSGFGGGLRWGFFQAEYLPISLSVQLASESLDFQNKINVSAQTFDLIASYKFEPVTIYLGGGTISASGEFLGGGADGVTDSGSVENVSTSANHYLSGLVYRFSTFFVAAEVDRAEQTCYGVKIGARF